MSPRIRVSLIALLVTAIEVTILTILSESWGPIEVKLSLIFLWSSIGIAIPIHFSIGFRENHRRYTRDMRSNEAGARFDQLITQEGGLTTINRDPEFISAYVGQAFNRQITTREFVGWIINMSLTGFLFGWFSLMSFAFDQ